MMNKTTRLLTIDVDGNATDDRAEASAINPQNPWAHYVYQVVTHLAGKYNDLGIQTQLRAIILIGLCVIGLTVSVLACAAPGTVRPNATSLPAPISETVTAISAQITPADDPPSVPMVQVPAGEFIMGSTRDQVATWNMAWKDHYESSTGLPALYDHFNDEGSLVFCGVPPYLGGMI